MHRTGGVLGRIAMADTMTAGGLATMTHDDDDIRRLYEGLNEVRGQMRELSITVTREVTMAQQRRPLLDQSLAELREKADKNGSDLAEIKAMIRDVTTVVRLVRWAGATVAAAGAAAVVSLGGWWDQIREMFYTK